MTAIYKVCPTSWVSCLSALRAVGLTIDIVIKADRAKPWEARNRRSRAECFVARIESLINQENER